MDYVVKAGTKHKETVVALKQVVEDQKKKLKEFRDVTTKMQDDIDNLEDEIRERHEFATNVSVDKGNLEKEMKFLIEKIDVKNEDIIRLEFNLEKKGELSQKLLKSLVDEKEELKADLDLAYEKLETEENAKTKAVDKEEKVKMFSDIENLLTDINKLQFENEEKEMLLKQFGNEKKKLNDEVIYLEERNATLMLQIDDVKHEEKEIKTNSLMDELSLVDKNVFPGEMYKCKYCEETFPCKMDLMKHIQTFYVQSMRIKLLKMEKKLSDQRVKVATSLINLKQVETNGKHKPCKCRGFCYINHKKHNWELSKSDKIYSKLENHVLMKHQNSGETENGGSTVYDKNTHSSLQGGMSE
jgi:hypothetical protein